MRTFHLFSITFFLITYFKANAVFAQLTPTEVLLKRSSQANSPADVLDSSRYEKRPGKKRVPAQNGSQTVTSESAKSTPKEEPKVLEPLQTPPPNSEVAPNLKPNENFSSGGFQEFILGGTSEEINKFRTGLEEQDTRKNVFELALSPVWIYNDSKSISWYRTYTTSTPAISLETQFWLSPFFGLNAGYSTTFSGVVNNAVSGRSNAPFVDDWTVLGFKFRTFYENSSRSANSSVGLSYRSYGRKLPSDDTGRLSLRTRSALIQFETQIPSTKRYSWDLGAEFAPFALHEELATGVRTLSGDKSETFGVGVTLGGEYLLDRSNRFFWKLNHFAERNLYTGPMSAADPVAGSVLTGASVTNSFTQFSVGHIWGF